MFVVGGEKSFSLLLSHRDGKHLLASGSALCRGNLLFFRASRQLRASVTFIAGGRAACLRYVCPAWQGHPRPSTMSAISFAQASPSASVSQRLRHLCAMSAMLDRLCSSRRLVQRKHRLYAWGTVGAQPSVVSECSTREPQGDSMMESASPVQPQIWLNTCNISQTCLRRNVSGPAANWARHGSNIFRVRMLFAILCLG